MKLCQACSGTYEPIGADGVRYFHTCPPVVCLVVTRDGVRKTVRLADVQKTDLVKVRRDDAIVDVAVSDRVAHDVFVEQHEQPRPNARDERIVDHVDGQEIIAAHGLGAVDVIVVPPVVDPFPPLEV